MISVEVDDSDTASFTEATDGSALISTGTLTATDHDSSNVSAVRVAGVSTSGVTAGLGLSAEQLALMLSVDPADPDAILSAGETTDQFDWTFNAGDQAFNYLAAGETLQLTYTVELKEPDQLASDFDANSFAIGGQLIWNGSSLKAAKQIGKFGLQQSPLPKDTRQRDQFLFIDNNSDVVEYSAAEMQSFGFSAGDELIFVCKPNNAGGWLTGDASRNSDNVIHARVSDLSDGSWRIG